MSVSRHNTGASVGWIPGFLGSFGESQIKATAAVSKSNKIQKRLPQVFEGPKMTQSYAQMLAFVLCVGNLQNPTKRRKIAF